MYIHGLPVFLESTAKDITFKVNALLGDEVVIQLRNQLGVQIAFNSGIRQMLAQHE